MTRVLVIDDDAGVRLILQRNLEHAGFEVLTAAGAQHGIEMARAQDPDIVVLDLMMPQVDGFDVLRELAGDTKTAKMPVIILTALTDPGIKERCQRAGASLVMTKPFEPSALANEIEKILDAQPRVTPVA